MEKINWSKASPKEISLKDLETAKEKDFPNTYSGQGWKACWLMYHKGYKVNKEEFLKQDGWGDFPYLKDIDLTGFMVGWACNALRHILKKSPVSDGATVIIGGGDNQPKGVHIDNAEESMKKAIGG